MEDFKSVYREIPKLSRAEIERAIADNDVEALKIAAISASMYGGDYEWAENLCIRLFEHDDVTVRGNAVLSFGHIASVFGALNEVLVKPIIERALKDPEEYVRGQAQDAVDDTKWFLKWKYKK